MYILIQVSVDGLEHLDILFILILGNVYLFIKQCIYWMACFVLCNPMFIYLFYKYLNVTPRSSLDGLESCVFIFI